MMSSDNVDGGAGEKNNCEEVKDIEQCWRGCSMQEIHRYLDPFELEHFAAVRPSEEHTVLHHFPIQNIINEPPRPYKCHHKWDAMHVRLPSSASSQYPVIGADGKSSIQMRWEMIEEALLRPINSSRELQSAILEYNSKYKSQWSFRALHFLFEDDLDESEARAFFDDLLPRIIRLALRLPELILAPIPLLRQGKTHSVTLTQQQISCLLANAFLCTFPRRNSLKKKSEYSTFPDINFNRLYQSSGSNVIEKIKCICHYFRRVCPAERDSLNVPTGVVTFSRRNIHYSDMPKWVECETPLGAAPIHITSAGTIEDQGEGLLQVDFANKYIGGGVLGSGCVQEEIRFVICPELIVSKLFTESLRPTEALIMIGCERFSIYKGYASTFQWCGNYADSTPCDSSRRRLTHIVAIDALSFVQSSHQYREELMLRELNKAYVGFYHPWQTPAPGIASGNWGCGAFRGDAKLKALLQLMACTVTKRPLVYFTFGDAELRDEVYRMHNFCMEQNVRVNDMWTALRKFHTHHLTSKDLYNFLYSCLRNEPKHSPNSRFDMYQPKCLDVQRVERMSFHRRDRDVSSVIEQTAPATSPASVSKSLNICFGDIKTDDISIRKPIQSNATPKNVSISTNGNAGARENSCTSYETKSTITRTATRQRTLLEMMDIYYKIDSSAPKRHCLQNK